MEKDETYVAVEEKEAITLAPLHGHHIVIRSTSEAKRIIKMLSLFLLRKQSGWFPRVLVVLTGLAGCFLVLRQLLRHVKAFDRRKS